MATYTSTTSGLWSLGTTWVGGVKPPSAAGHKIIIAAGHTVTFDETSGTYGDDTSSTTIANNAIVVNGTLKFSRLVSTILTCNGTLALASGGALDMGSTTDPITLVTAILELNKSATMAAGKHTFYTNPGTGTCTITAFGVVKSRNTTLSSSTASGSNQITVASSVGWAIGDEIVVASDSADPSAAVYTTITGGASPTWTLAASVGTTRPIGTSVGNLSSNVVVRANTANLGTPFVINGGTAGKVVTDIHHVRFQNLVNTTGWTGASQTAPNFTGVSLTAASSSPGCLIDQCAIIHTDTTAQTSAGLVIVNSPSLEYASFTNCALYSASTAIFGVYFAQSGLGKIDDCYIYKTTKGYNTAFSAGGILSEINRGAMWCSDYIASLNAGQITCNNVMHKTPGAVVGSYVSARVLYNSGSIECNTRLLISSTNSQGGIDTNGTTLLGATLTGDNTTGSIPSQISRSKLYLINGITSYSRDVNYHRVCDTDLSTRNNSSTAVRLQPKVASLPITYTYTIPAVSGSTQTIKGSLRFDGTYGTATPPSITLSGQGVTQTFTAPGVADTWHSFSFVFTPTATGDITATVTVQSTSTTGYVWLDGIYHYPMIQTVRHWGYQWLPQAAQVVDSRITLSLSAAQALPVSVDYIAQTVTISGNVSPSEALQAMLSSLAVNLDKAVHVTGDGTTFSTTYTVILSGGRITGPYTDSSGLHVEITAPNIVSGSRVLLKYTDDNSTIYDGVLSSSGVVIPLLYTSTRPIRMYAAFQNGTEAKKLIVADALLQSTGATLLNTQEEDTIYNSNGIDGSSINNITWNVGSIDIDFSGSGGVFGWKTIYASYVAELASPLRSNIDDFANLVTAVSEVEYIFDGSIQFNYIGTGAGIVVGGDAYGHRTDNSFMGGTGNIQFDNGKSYVSNASSSIIWADASALTVGKFLAFK